MVIDSVVPVYFTNTYFGKSIALFLLVLLTNTIPHVGLFTKEILNTLRDG